MDTPPLLSVVIPSHGRPGPLRAALRALLQSDCPREVFELIVVDDASPGVLESQVSAEVEPARVRWVRLAENAGPAEARNEGARAARGTYLLFIDDDCLADRRWVSRMRAALEARPGAAVGGRVVDGSGGSLLCAADQWILDVAYAHYNADPERAQFFATLNLAVPADGFREMGGFDPTYRTAEDREFCARWLASGRRLACAPDALVTHAAASSLGRFWRRHYAFGEGAYRFRSRHTRVAGRHVALEPPGFYRRLVWAPFTRGVGLNAAAIAALIVVSQAASALGFAAAWRRDHTSKGRSA